MRWDIQALRALAVIAVVIYHIWPTRLEGGFMGVDIFFVISGYLMTLTIWKGVVAVRQNKKKKVKESAKFLFNFYARRIKRLAPAATVCLLAVLFAVLALGNYGIQQQTAQQTMMSTIFLQNWQLAGEAVDYLGADNAPTAVQHFWSLSIEEQFYMIWPLLLIILGFIGIFIITKSRKKIAKWIGNNFQVIFITLFTIATFICGFWMTQTDPAAAYFVTPARIWELALGGIIVFLPKIKNGELKLLLPWFGLALCLYALMKWDGVGFPGWHALVPTIGTALIIWAGSDKNIKGKFSIQNLSKFRPVQFFGDISYSLYLWHWPLIILLPLFLHIDMTQNSILKIVVLIASIFLAWLSFRFIESTTRKWSLSNAKIWVIGIGCLAVVVIPSILVRDAASYKIDNIYETVYEKVNSDDVCFGAKSIQNQSKCASFGNINSEYAQFATTTFMATSDKPSGLENMTVCDNFTKDDSNDMYCEFGDLDSDKTVLILGDSFSEQWYSSFDITGKRLGYKVIGANAVSCGGGLTELTNSVYGKDSSKTRTVEDCNDRFNWIRNNLWQESDKIIIAVAPSYLQSNLIDEKTKQEYSLGIAHTIQDFNNLYNIKPILIQSIPTISNSISKEAALQCMTNYNCSTLKEGQIFEMNLVYNNIQSTSVEYSLDYLNIEDLFCDNINCHSQIGGLPVYYNVNHINSMFSASTSNFFVEYLSKEWNI